MNITIDSNETAHFTLGNDEFEAYAASWISMNAEFVLRVIKNGEFLDDYHFDWESVEDGRELESAIEMFAEIYCND